MSKTYSKFITGLQLELAKCSFCNRGRGSDRSMNGVVAFFVFSYDDTLLTGLTFSFAAERTVVFL